MHLLAATPGQIDDETQAVVNVNTIGIGTK